MNTTDKEDHNFDAKRVLFYSEFLFKRKIMVKSSFPVRVFLYHNIYSLVGVATSPHSTLQNNCRISY